MVGTSCKQKIGKRRNEVEIIINLIIDLDKMEGQPYYIMIIREHHKKRKNIIFHRNNRKIWKTDILVKTYPNLDI